MSNETNKSAVEQLAIALYENGFLQGDGDRIQEIIDIFREMEKEKLEDAWVEGFKNWNPSKTFEQYYNETYGGNK
jgi:hypothetical protein